MIQILRSKSDGIDDMILEEGQLGYKLSDPTDLRIGDGYSEFRYLQSVGKSGSSVYVETETIDAKDLEDTEAGNCFTSAGTREMLFIDNQYQKGLCIRDTRILTVEAMYNTQVPCSDPDVFANLYRLGGLFWFSYPVNNPVSTTLMPSYIYGDVGGVGIKPNTNPESDWMLAEATIPMQIFCPYEPYDYTPTGR